MRAIDIVILFFTVAACALHAHFRIDALRERLNELERR